MPDAAILREVQGRTSWESLAATARILRNRDLRSVLVVSDPYHSLRAREMARELGLNAHVLAHPHQPGARVGASGSGCCRRRPASALARFIGYRRLLQISG